MVAGSRAPHPPEPRPIHHLPDDAFIRELKRFSGTPEAIRENPELMAFYLPILRADFRLDETHVHAAGAPLDCPVAAFGGTSDPEAAEREIAGWADHTTGSFSLEMFEGNHFFLHSALPALLSSVERLLSRCEAGAVPPPMAGPRPSSPMPNRIS